MPKVNIQIMNGLYLWRFSIMIHAQIVAHFVGYHIHYQGPSMYYVNTGEGVKIAKSDLLLVWHSYFLGHFELPYLP